jgi:histidinol-phosphate/aromatic aminotransferase/cobyric acid decarboxylase-like protein
VVIRSLTKLAAIPGLRLGYALADPTRLARWAAWRDPWPVNGLATAAGVALMADRAWDQRVQGWLAREYSFWPWERLRSCSSQAFWSPRFQLASAKALSVPW